MKKQAITAELSQAERKRLKSLHTGKGRAKAGQFLAEGIRLLEESLRHKWLPEIVFYAEALLAERGKRFLGRLAGHDVSVRAISAKDISRIAGTESSQGVVSLFNIPGYEVAEIYRKAHRWILLLDNISDPGNAGTLVRSACAFGFDLVLLLPNSVEPFNPKVVRASAGAIFAVPVMTVSVDEVAELKQKRKLVMVTGDLAGRELRNLKISRMNRGFILAIGSEAVGVSDEIRRLSDAELRITHDNSVESLNAAVAGSILMRDFYDTLIRRAKR